MKSFEAIVRANGTINLRKKNNANLGIKPGSTLLITIKDGVAEIRPKGYICSVCGHKSKEPLDSLGMCKECNAMITKFITNGKYKSVSEAMAHTASIRKERIIGK